MTEPLVPAPLWRRVAALAIDAGIGIGLFGILSASIALVMAPWWLRSGREQDSPDESVPEWLARPFRRLQDPAWKIAFEHAMLTQQIGRRNRTWPGGRLMRIRTVDARTGGPVGNRSTIAGAIAGKLQGVLMSELYVPQMRRAKEQQEALRPQLAVIRERHRETRDAVHRDVDRGIETGSYVDAVRNTAALDEIERRFRESSEREEEEIAELYRAADYNPTAGCQRGLIALAISAGIELASAVTSPQRQTLAQRIAGTMTVRA